MNSNFNNVTIVGVGLIGGSLGLAIKERKMASKVIGVGRREVSMQKAIDANSIDEATLDIKKGVEKSDLVIIATPIDKVVDIAKKALKYMPRNSILTDVASTKRDIVEQIEENIPENIYYVGSHPIAGSEKTGVEFAKSTMFDNSNCIITFTENTNREVLNKVESFWKDLSAKVTIMSPDDHDKIIAVTSHVPHIIASVLVKNAEFYFNSTGGSFKDITRVALSSSEMWTYIFMQNRKYILESINDFVNEFKKFSDLIDKKDKKTLINILNDTKSLREKLGKEGGDVSE